METIKRQMDSLTEMVTELQMQCNAIESYSNHPPSKIEQITGHTVQPEEVTSFAKDDSQKMRFVFIKWWTII